MTDDTPDLTRPRGMCHQCWDASRGRQHTNGPCRCTARCPSCRGTGTLGTHPCDRCVAWYDEAEVPKM